MDFSHSHNQLRFFSLLMILFVSLASFNLSFSPNTPLLKTIALAEGEDEGKEDEEDEDEEDEDQYEETQEAPKETKKKSSSSKTVEVVKEVVEYKPVQQTVMVTEDAYQKDTDGDALVDALDPDPLVDQREYFTDTDTDGVPNAIDQYHDEDDFTYYDLETDDDNNGIIDSYEG